MDFESAHPRLSAGRLATVTAVSVGIALLLYLPSQYLKARFPNQPLVERLMILLGVMALVTPSVYTTQAVRGVRSLRVGSFLSIVALVMVSVLDVTMSLPALKGVVFLGEDSGLGRVARPFLLWFGAATLIGTLYFSIAELTKAREATEEAVLLLRREVADRVKAAEALRESESRFRGLCENSLAGVYILQNDRLTYVNPAVGRIFGYDPAAMVGIDPMKLVHPGDREFVAENVRLRMGGGVESMHYSFRGLRSDGSEVAIEVLGVRMNLNGCPSIVGHLLDMTERKRLEAELSQSKRLESVGQLAGGVAHDFNNILAATMLHLGYLQQKEGLDQQTRELLAELMGGAERAVSLTRQLLMFSGQSVIELKPLDLNSLVVEMVPWFGRVLGDRIKVDVHAGHGLPLVGADRGMVTQVLMNLGMNARDAMPSGGRLTLRTEFVHVDEAMVLGKRSARPGAYVCLVVGDTGCGMDEAVLDRIFDPFFTTKSVGSGTGLGLATVHGILAQHRGWAEVESELGKGSVFRVYLPVVGVGGRLAEPDEVELPAVVGGAGLILVVEDEPSVRRAVVRGLRMLGYDLVEAADGREALNRWRALGGKVDLLLTDMVMPGGMTGLALATALRLERPDLPVIISSGYNAELVSPEYLANQEMEFLQKPYPVEHVARLIRTCLDRRRNAAPVPSSVLTASDGAQSLPRLLS